MYFHIQSYLFIVILRKVAAKVYRINIMGFHNILGNSGKRVCVRKIRRFL